MANNSANKAIISGGNSLIAGAGTFILPPDTPWWGQMIWVGFWALFAFGTTWWTTNHPTVVSASPAEPSK